MVHEGDAVGEPLEVADEGASYTFGMRKGHKWSDGSDFTADDIMFLYDDQWQDPDLSPNGIGGWLAAGGDPVVVEKLDDYTVKFSFGIPYGLFMLYIAANGEGTEITYTADLTFKGVAKFFTPFMGSKLDEVGLKAVTGLNTALKERQPTKDS